MVQAQFQTIFDTVKLPFIWYLVIVGIAIFLLICFSGYFWFEYSKGISVKELFWGRIKGWTNRKIAILEIFNPINTVRFEYGHREIGDVYKFGETSEDYIPQTESKKGILNKLINIFGSKKKQQILDSSLKSEIITPKSVYTINGIKTVPLFEPYPQLNKIVIKGINSLIENGIYNLKELEDIVDDVERRNKILFDDYTYEKFYELYLSTKNKYEYNITVNDVVNFMGSTSDKNFRETIEAKEFNINIKKSEVNNSKYKTFLLIFGVVIAGIMIVYKVIWG